MKVAFVGLIAGPIGALIPGYLGLVATDRQIAAGSRELYFSEMAAGYQGFSGGVQLLSDAVVEYLDGVEDFMADRSSDPNLRFRNQDVADLEIGEDAPDARETVEIACRAPAFPRLAQSVEKLDDGFSTSKQAAYFYAPSRETRLAIDDIWHGYLRVRTFVRQCHDYDPGVNEYRGGNVADVIRANRALRMQLDAFLSQASLEVFNRGRPTNWWTWITE
jgi:hypothetical protein